MSLSRIFTNRTSRRVALKGLVGASAVATSLRSHLTFAQDSTPTPDPADANITPAKLKGPQTLLVGGLDTRKEGEPENSDVLMLVRIDLDAKTLRVLSINRDLYIDIPGFGADKITRAYDFGSKAQNGKFKAGVYWYAPAINTVLLRFSEDEVREILTYGRPGTPMPAWGVAGGGPMTTQQIDELIAYLKSIQISYKDAREEVEVSLRKALGLPEGAKIDYRDPAVGKALFNLGLGDDPGVGLHGWAPLRPSPGWAGARAGRPPPAWRRGRRAAR